MDEDKQKIYNKQNTSEKEKAMQDLTKNTNFMISE